MGAVKALVLLFLLAAPACASVLTNEPGYVPPVDPDSAAVRTGHRAAPLVSQRFTGGAKSLDALARAILAASASGDRAALAKMCVTKSEFANILWPEFPQSRPVTGATADDGWYFLKRRNEGGLGRLLGDWKETKLTFVKIEQGTNDRYRNFRLHRGLTIVARTPEGETVRLDDLRTVAERKGVYKIYSMKD
jgi:hypothetical protein